MNCIKIQLVYYRHYFKSPKSLQQNQKNVLSWEEKKQLLGLLVVRALRPEYGVNKQIIN